jgi:hypothetical protein
MSTSTMVCSTFNETIVSLPQSLNSLNGNSMGSASYIPLTSRTYPYGMPTQMMIRLQNNSLNVHW